MATQLVITEVGPLHHRQRVPADQRADTPLHIQITGEVRLTFRGNAVDVGRGQIRQLYAVGTGPFGKPVKQVFGAFRPGAFQQGIEGIHPFLGFDRIKIIVKKFTGHSCSTPEVCKTFWVLRVCLWQLFPPSPA